MRRLRVAQVVAVYPPYRGGMARIAEEYTVRLRRRGHAVDVFTARHGGVRGEPAYVHRLRGLRLGNASIVPSLAYRLREYDIVHLHYPYFGGAEFALGRRFFTPSQPLVLTYHMDSAASGVRGFIFRAHRRVVLPCAAAIADRILVSSLDYAAASSLSELPGARRRMEVHPFGVDLDRFRPGPELELRSQRGAAPGEVVLLFVGTLDAAHHFKGLPLLFDALSDVRHPGWRLTVVGDGPLRPSFERLAHARGMSSRVSFATGVSDGELPRYYRAADVHLFPSTGPSEAYGLVVLEAAASGIPSIVSNLPGVRTLVRPGATGWHVPPGNRPALRAAIEHALDHPGERCEFGRRARSRVESECGWDPLIDRLEGTYESSLAGA